MPRIVKNIIAPTLILCLSFLLALVLAEFTLYALGKYSDQVNAQLVPSEAIWERPANATNFRSHPDLRYKFEVKFDGSGLRNHSGNETKDKSGIIGFFGGSFTENRRIEDRFIFTTIFSKLIDTKYSVANFGVDGYGPDQSFLRFRKHG